MDWNGGMDYGIENFFFFIAAPNSTV